MNHVQYLCVFVRATGARLLAAERLVCSLPALLGPALCECDLAYRASSRDLVVLLRFSAGGVQRGAAGPAGLLGGAGRRPRPGAWAA